MRAANFTSSQVHKLTSFDRSGNKPGASFYTYVEEKRWELRLGRELQKETSARPLSWGKLCERYVFDTKLGTDYKHDSDFRYKHKDLPWSGMPDLIKFSGSKIAHFSEIKCPFEIKSFCKTVDALSDWETLKKTRPDLVWQMVSNAILTGTDKAEAIIYCPYREDLMAIIESASNFDGDQNQFAWMNWQTDMDFFPYLLKEGSYKDLNNQIFTIPPEDKEFLTQRIELAAKELRK